MNLTIFHEGTSPFDQIRQVDEFGTEYWLARQLQPLLGYTQWRRFEETIERAKLACENSGLSVDEHFLPTLAKSSGGRPGNDYRLSRYSSYLVAMNGDPRKPEISAAQSYFAVKTRVAELAPQVSELISQLLLKIEQQNQIIQEHSSALAELQTQVQNLLPPTSNSPPPGWNPEIWQQLPPQDKQHFRFLYRRRQFVPSNQVENETLALHAFTEEIKLRERLELEAVIGEVTESEKARIEALKQEALKGFWEVKP